MENKKLYDKKSTHTIISDSITVDHFGSKKIVYKLKEKEGPIDKPLNRFVTQKTALILDNDGDIIEEDIFVDEKGNVIKDDDIEIVKKKYINKTGNTRYKRMYAIKNFTTEKMTKINNTESLSNSSVYENGYDIFNSNK